MTDNLPPEDRPSGQGLVSGSEEETLAAAEETPPDDPWWIGLAFHAAVTSAEGIDLDRMVQLVTPESLPNWGDFTVARQLLDNTGMTTKADRPAPGVAYVKFVSDTGQTFMADSDVMIMARAVATLQFRPELDQWRVHSLGDYCLPEDLPSLP